MKSNKAQVRFFETVAVLVIFTILVVTGIFAYGKVRSANIEKQNKENLELQAINIARMAANMPELKCSKEVIENCVDAIKIEAAKDIITKNQDYYFGLFKRSKIQICEIYPEDKCGESAAPIYTVDILPEDLEKLSKTVNEAPVLIYNPATKRGSFGVIKVEVYT